MLPSLTRDTRNIEEEQLTVIHLLYVRFVWKAMEK